MTKASILIVEDKFILAQDLAVTLRKLGYSVCAVAESGAVALAKARELHPTLVLMDIHLKGDDDGITTASRIKSELDIPIIFLSAHSDDETIVRASAVDPIGYLLKPFDERQLYTTLELALNQNRARRSIFVEANRELQLTDGLPDEPASPEVRPLVAEVRRQHEFSGIIGSHPVLLQLLHNVNLVAKTDIGVHIYGENGTGKELIADAIHSLSPRRSRPFIKLNCSAIPASLLESALFGHAKGAFTGAAKDQEGFIERAEGGTLFLDEIGDISADIQVKLLRVLQSGDYNRVGDTTFRKADIRVVTATNKRLKELVEQGKIREDFYYRIHVFPLEVPPLRDRGDDVLLIAHHFRLLFNKLFSKQVTGFTDSAEVALLAYGWPGNVRELENAMRRAFVLVTGRLVDLAHLPDEVASTAVGFTEEPESGTSLDGERESSDSERAEILDALEKAGGRKGAAARLLGYSRVTLWKKMTRLGLAAENG